MTESESYSEQDIEALLNEDTSTKGMAKYIPSTLTIIFLAIPILLLVFFILKKPSFVVKKSRDKDEKEITILNYKLILFICILIGILIPALYFGYVYYTKNKKN